MKINSDLLKKYNTPDTILVVSTYPRKNHTYDPQALAVAPVTKNKINALKLEAEKMGKPIKFVVLADDIYGPDMYEEDGHLIVRAWKRNQLNVYWSIQKIINQFNKTKTLHFEHEFGIFGLKNTITAQLPIFFAINRLKGKRIVMVLHQVIFNLEQLSGHLKLDPKSFKVRMLNFLIRANYILFGVLANELVVLDAALKDRLSKYVLNSKIHAIPHGNRGQKITYSKAEARKELALEQDTFYIVFLGYVTWYKGADWIVDTFYQIQSDIKTTKKVKLIIAGGESSSMEKEPKYMQFYSDLKQTIVKSNNVHITGVLESEEELDRYAKAADLLVMPYRVMMAASGIFAIAQNAESSVVISENLKPTTMATDVQGALAKAGLTTNDILFEYTAEGLLHTIQRTIDDSNYQAKLSTFASSLAEERTDQSQARHYLALVMPQAKPRFFTRVVHSFARVNS